MSNTNKKEFRTTRQHSPLRIGKTSRGFRSVLFPTYIDRKDDVVFMESSAIDFAHDGLEYPGSSYLFFGNTCRHHLNRDDVRRVIAILQHWLDNKRLPEHLSGDGITEEREQ